MSTMHPSKQQTGVVSLVVTLIMMIVITLIVLGFAEIARTEQRNSLDDQLSAQAYYAAESGVNDVRAIINATLAGGNPPVNKSSCANVAPYLLNTTVDSAHNASYTCITVDTTPTTLTHVIGNDSWVTPIISTSGAAFGTLSLSWGAPAGYAGSAQNCYTNLGLLSSYPVASGSGQWDCDFPVVRVDLLNASGLSRANWNANTTTVFFVPFSGIGGSAAWGTHGLSVAAKCTTASKQCTSSITGLVGSNYYMRVSTVYRTGSTLIVSAGGLKFSGAQAVIDSTGKAQDILKRIRVAVDLTDANATHIPSAAIVSRDSVCKRFSVTSGSFNVYDDLSNGGGQNLYCDFQSNGTPAP